MYIYMRSRLGLVCKAEPFHDVRKAVVSVKKFDVGKNVRLKPQLVKRQDFLRTCFAYKS